MYTSSADKKICTPIFGLAKSLRLELVEKSFKSIAEAVPPTVKSPVIISEGRFIFGVPAILNHIARCFPAKSLLGRSFAEQSEVTTLTNYFTGELTNQLNAVVECEDEPEDSAVKALTKTIQYFESLLNSQSFAVGHYLTVADYILASLLLRLPTDGTDLNIDKYTSLKRYICTVYPSSRLLDFNMDKWKRIYSNSKSLRKDALPQFWNDYDNDKMSIWSLKYQRYNDTENVEAYKASNLLGMFLQRFDNELRKDLFGVCNVLDKKSHYDIEGVLVCSTKNLPQSLKDHDQFESFEWVELCPIANKKYIEDYFCEFDEIDGHPISSCKVYK